MNVRSKKINSNITVICSYGNVMFGIMGVFLENEDTLLIYSEGEFDYIIEGISLDEAEDITDLLQNEPGEDTWERYHLDDESVYDEFENYFGDRESYAQGLRYIGAIPSNANVFCDVEGDKVFNRFIRNLIQNLY